ncbi:MAG: Nramp family divalent metal transporter [candidate division NC10 bacterium]|nr:Nramp family divalent metal transporter [candidate division NC10 bacterium]MBI2114297.1 Nramp family divalent metal transporter [candidate division NC10 bacterium]MBI2564038.1 Nramp family divalent metal transporter [candidate division NC10 bacterium]
MSAEPVLSDADPGYGPRFERDDFPAPPRDLTFRKLTAVLGPAVIALGGTIGGGEWLVGPALFVKWGLALLWITTVSSLLQVFLNLEMCRYTLYTGEPITVGFMRLAPGKAFWGWIFTIAGFLERALPGWALGAATALAAFHLSRIPGAPDRGTVVIWGYIVFASCCIIISFGRTIERTLEWANWIMMIVVLGGLFLLDLYIVPASVWWEGIKGFFTFGFVPRGVDLLLLGALVGYSAYGGFGNNAISNWYRDKGYGMGGKVGYIPAAIGGKEVHVSHVGKIAPQTPENAERFKGWWKLLNIDQWVVFYGGAMAGMFLPGILYVGTLPRGEALPSWGIAASTASGLIQKMGNFGWFLALFFGFWILYSTAVSNVDLVVRQATDMLWWGVEGIRRWAKADIRRIYYTLLIVFFAWGVTFVNITLPLVIFAISANIANFTMALSAILTIRVNRKFLPKEYRGSTFREVMLVLNLVFFGFFFTVFLLNRFFGLKF